MNVDQNALDYIAELEADLVAEGQRIDLLQEACDELTEENRALKGQLAMIMRDVLYEVA